MNDTRTSGASNAVYVQTNTTPNDVIAFRRSDDGSLDRIGSVATGGDGSGSPHLQSQGSVVLTRDGQHLLVTNAGSDDLSVFSVASDGSLALRNRVNTGSTPRSVAERNGFVVVLNTGEPSLASFRLSADGIAQVTDQVLASDADPAQVGFSPDGSMVVITQRGTDSIVTYQFAADGSFGASSTVGSQGPTPYGFGFSSGGTLVVTEAFRAEKGAAAASSYAIVDGSLEPLSGSVGNGRSEICWAVVTPDGNFAFTTNFADGAVSRYAIAADGSLSLDDATAGIAVDGMTGLRDEDLSDDGRFLYVIDTDGGRIMAGRSARRARWSRSGLGKAFRRPWLGSRRAKAAAKCDSSRSTQSPSRRRKPGALRSPGTRASKVAASCWPRERSTGRLSARYRAANFPRKRADGALVPEFRWVLETDDGGAILFEWQGLAVRSDSGRRRLLGSLVHTTDHPRYRWLNDRVCAVEGEVRPRTDASGSEVVFEVSEMVWEGVP